MESALIYGVAAFIMTAIITPLLIPMLKRMKFGQSIRTEGPESHMVKTGTPTMGGLSFLATIMLLLIVLLFTLPHYNTIFLLMLVTLSFGLIGFIDDYLIVVKKVNEGLSSKQKFLAQVIVAIIFYALAQFVGLHEFNNAITIPVFNFDIPLSYAYVLFVIFWLVGFSNAVNLTDGLDGLATGLSMIAFAGFMVIAHIYSNFEVFIFCAIVIGSLGGFLIYNKNKAKLFMGDTGSLALGGMIASVSILLGAEVVLLIIGLMFVIETASVMLQVAYFKKTEKRIFKMTPIHHHFELSGWSEWKIAIVFWIVGILTAILGVWIEVL